MIAVAQALEPLDGSGRKRVLRAVAVLYGAEE